MTEANIKRSAEERLAEIEETRRKNRERQQKHRRAKKEAEPSDAEKRYRESPQFYWDTNLKNLEQHHPVEYAQVRSIEAEYKRIQAAIHDVIEKVPEFHKPALLKRKEREVPNVLQLYKDLKKFQAANYYYPNIISQPGYPAGGRAVAAPGAEFCQMYPGHSSERDMFACYGIFLWFDLHFIRDFLKAAIFHLLVEGTPDQEMLRRMIEEHKEDVVRGFADRHKEEALSNYPPLPSGDEAAYAFLGLRMKAFLGGEPFVPPSVEQPKRYRPPIVVQLPDTYGASFPITPRGEL
jgi:hypothetical protein